MEMMQCLRRDDDSLARYGVKSRKANANDRVFCEIIRASRN
jgi:hypothetical protein